jgi:hypothetical protein
MGSRRPKALRPAVTRTRSAALPLIVPANAVIDALAFRRALTGHGRFVDGALTGHDHAIRRDATPGPHTSRMRWGNVTWLLPK